MAEILETIDWSPLFISLKTGILATVLAFFAGIAAGYDWHRPLYRTERNAFCWTSQRNININAAAGVASADSVSICVDSGDDCPWNDSPTGARVGLAGRCKCRHVEPVTGSGAKAVCLV